MRHRQASMVRDDERRSEAGERRSKGYGFVTFKAKGTSPSQNGVSQRR